MEQTQGGTVPPFFEQGAPFYLWGIVNTTPDSFFDGGLYAQPEKALAHALRLAEEGAAVLDIGAASSRPGSADVPASEELERLLPVLTALRAHWPNRAKAQTFSADSAQSALEPPARTPPLLSVDTWRAAVAAAVLQAGADIINDISAAEWEPELVEVLADYKPVYVLMHSQGRPGFMQTAPHYADVVTEVFAFFERRLNALVRAGLPEDHIFLDPGIGFGKNLEHNCALLAQVKVFERLGRPVLMGLSNKSLFKDFWVEQRLHEPGAGQAESFRAEAAKAEEKKIRAELSLVATAKLALDGVRHHRVHDVAAARQAILLVQALTSV